MTIDLEGSRGTAARRTPPASLRHVQQVPKVPGYLLKYVPWEKATPHHPTTSPAPGLNPAQALGRFDIFDSLSRSRYQEVDTVKLSLTPAIRRRLASLEEEESFEEILRATSDPSILSVTSKRELLGG